MSRSTHKPIVAVIIPVYNKQDTVARAIKSVQEQTVKNIEIVIVDDGSKDNSARIINDTICDDPRCVYVYQENAGVANARNNGVFNHSTAPFVMCLDSDDAIEPGYLEHLLPTLATGLGLGIVYTALKWVKPDGSTGISAWPHEFDADAMLTGKNQIPTAALTKRKVWERLGGQRQRFAPLGAGSEDADFWLRAVSYGFDAKYVKPVQGAFFVYSWLSGLVSGNKDYVEVDWKIWSPWTEDKSISPLPALSRPYRFSHPARQYDEPIVSVIIPVGPGHMKYLTNALDSLDAQMYQKWEAIVIFDIGTEEWQAADNDGTLSYIARTWPFARFTSTHANGVFAREIVDVLDIYEKGGNILAALPSGVPKGAGAARNIGIRAARGSLLLFLDADDWLKPKDSISKFVSAFRGQGQIIISDHAAFAFIKKEDLDKVDGKVIGYNDRTGEAVIEQGVAKYDCQRAMEQPYMDGRPPYVICSVTSLVPKKWAEQVGGFPEDLHSWEDVWFFWKLAWRGRCFYKIDEPLFAYRYASGFRRQRGFENRHELLKKLRAMADEEKKMGCNCGPDKPVTLDHGGSIMTQATATEGAYPLTLTNGETLYVADKDLVLVKFQPTNLGNQARYGQANFGGGVIFYGHRFGGEEMLVHVEDVRVDHELARAQGRDPMFIPIQDAIEAVEDEEGVMEELPEPELWEESAEKEEDARSVTKIEDLDFGQHLRSKVLDALFAASIFTVWDVLEHEAIYPDGIASIPGIGETTRKRILEAIDGLEGN